MRVKSELLLRFHRALDWKRGTGRFGKEPAARSPKSTDAEILIPHTFRRSLLGRTTLCGIGELLAPGFLFWRQFSFEHRFELGGRLLAMGLRE